MSIETVFPDLPHESITLESPLLLTLVTELDLVPSHPLHTPPSP